MSTDVVSEYAKACEELESRRVEMQSLVDTANRAAEKLYQNWQKMSFPDRHGKYGPSSEPGGPLYLDASEWPTFQELARAQKAWHEAKTAAINIYQNKIPSHLHSTIPPRHLDTSGQRR